MPLLAAALALPLLLLAEEAPPAPLVAAVALQPSDGPASPGAPLARDGESAVDPSATFRVEVGVPLAGARLALYDAQEALVPAEGLAEIGSAGSLFTLRPRPPLRPGSHYVLRLEGAAEQELRDLSGLSYRPLTFPLRTTGEPPAEPPPRKARKPRR